MKLEACKYAWKLFNLIVLVFFYWCLTEIKTTRRSFCLFSQVKQNVIRAVKETAKCWVGIKAGSMIKFLMLDIDHDSKHLIKGYKSGRIKLIIKAFLNFSETVNSAKQKVLQTQMQASRLWLANLFCVPRDAEGGTRISLSGEGWRWGQIKRVGEREGVSE